MLAQICINKWVTFVAGFRQLASYLMPPMFMLECPAMRYQLFKALQRQYQASTLR